MLRTPDNDESVAELQVKIKTLSNSVWDGRAEWPQVTTWLEQFSSDPEALHDEQLQALRLLSNFLYFGVPEIRAILRSLLRDIYIPQVSKESRLTLGRHPSLDDLKADVERQIRNTRFVSLGNPSESSALLLYYFRQENLLPKTLFLHASEIFDLSQVGTTGSLQLRDATATRYVFIDDLCGSGHQACQYSSNFVGPIKSVCPAVRTYYYPLFGLSTGMDFVSTGSAFDVVHPVVELDSSFRAFSPESRLFNNATLAPHRALTEETCRRYGDRLWPRHPLGYEDSQLYIGFAHNTPDNSLPIFWSDHTAPLSWKPIFKRYPKVYW